jgi:hypothetical protein
MYSHAYFSLNIGVKVNTNRSAFFLENIKNIMPQSYMRHLASHPTVQGFDFFGIFLL